MSNKQYKIGKGDFCEVTKGKYKNEIIVVTGAIEIEGTPMVIIKIDGGLQTTISRKDLKLL